VGCVLGASSAATTRSACPARRRAVFGPRPSSGGGSLWQAPEASADLIDFLPGAVSGDWPRLAARNLRLVVLRRAGAQDPDAAPHATTSRGIIAGRRGRVNRAAAAAG